MLLFVEVMAESMGTGTGRIKREIGEWGDSSERSDSSDADSDGDRESDETASSTFSYAQLEALSLADLGVLGEHEPRSPPVVPITDSARQLLNLWNEEGGGGTSVLKRCCYWMVENDAGPAIFRTDAPSWLSSSTTSRTVTRKSGGGKHSKSCAAASNDDVDLIKKIQALTAENMTLHKEKEELSATLKGQDLHISSLEKTKQTCERVLRIQSDKLDESREEADHLRRLLRDSRTQGSELGRNKQIIVPNEANIGVKQRPSTERRTPVCRRTEQGEPVKVADDSAVETSPLVSGPVLAASENHKEERYMYETRIQSLRNDKQKLIDSIGLQAKQMVVLSQELAEARKSLVNQTSAKGATQAQRDSVLYKELVDVQGELKKLQEEKNELVDTLSQNEHVIEEQTAQLETTTIVLAHALAEIECLRRERNQLAADSEKAATQLFEAAKLLQKPRLRDPHCDG